MTKRLYILIAAVLVLCVLCALAFTGAEGVVMSTAPGSEEACYGRLSIPSAGIDAPLYRVHDDCVCCYFGLYNGGRINASDDIDWSAISLYDWARIRPILDGSLVLECVEIADCIAIGGWLIGLRGPIQADGDVLLCVSRGCWPVVRVYRWTRL